MACPTTAMSPPSQPHALPGVALQALAAGDFQALAAQFSAAGVVAELPGPGMLLLRPARPVTMQLLLSVGIHGNETAPITLLATVLDDLAQVPHSLAVSLLIAVGNLPAIARGVRFIDTDLNRLFDPQQAGQDETAEGRRADCLMQASADFFQQQAQQKWHLDLHSAIRPSHYARFAVLPVTAEGACGTLIRWLGHAAIEALLFNAQPAPTFSGYTARTCEASSCTLELGQVAVLGMAPAQHLARTRQALILLLQGQSAAAGAPVPRCFQVVQELVKHSTQFQLAFDAATPNFTALAPGTLIARDAAQQWQVGPQTGYVVFANPHVQIGQRAGLVAVSMDPQPASVPHTAA